MRVRILRSISRFTESNALRRSTAAESPIQKSRRCSLKKRSARMRSTVDFLCVEPLLAEAVEENFCQDFGWQKEECKLPEVNTMLCVTLPFPDWNEDAPLQSVGMIFVFHLKHGKQGAETLTRNGNHPCVSNGTRVSHGHREPIHLHPHGSASQVT